MCALLRAHAGALFYSLLLFHLFSLFCGAFLGSINEHSFGSTARMRLEVRQANECDVKCDALIMSCFTCDLLVPSGKVTLTGFCVCVCV